MVGGHHGQAGYHQEEEERALGSQPRRGLQGVGEDVASPGQRKESLPEDLCHPHARSLHHL